MIHEWEVLLRLFLSIVAGGVIGLEREHKGHPAGIRTHILLTMGSALIMLVSIDGFSGFPQRDPARLAAQVVSGIGFLCAGTIMRTGGSIHGLTSAASLWVSGGIGLAFGAGYYLGATLTTALVFLTLFVLAMIQERFFVREILVLEILANNSHVITPITKHLDGLGVTVADLSINRLNDSERRITFFLTTHKSFEKNLALEEISDIAGVISSSWQDIFG